METSKPEFKISVISWLPNKVKPSEKDIARVTPNYYESTYRDGGASAKGHEILIFSNGGYIAMSRNQARELISALIDSAVWIEEMEVKYGTK